MRALHYAAFTALSVISSSSMAQSANSDPSRVAVEQRAMSLLDWMDGQWRGEARVRTPDGEHVIVQTERAGSMLDGAVKVVEGLGINPDGSVGFNALAVISFDPSTGQYAFRSYAQGYAGTFPVTVWENQYVWQTPAGPGAIIRYTAKLENGRWHEVGERIADGQEPQPVFEMTLERTGDTSWPSAR